MRPKLDPELGVVASAKKDDDLYAKGGGRGQSSGWRAKSGPRIPPRKTLKRLGLLLLVVVAVYIFVHNIPTDLGPRDSRRLPPPYSHKHTGGLFQPPAPNQNDIPSDGRGNAVATRDFDGAVRFLELAETLHGISATKGQQPVNKNVLFMASSVRSASTLLPIACQMGRELRAYIHFALLARTEISIQELREINGIDDGCHLLFHDARPDFTSISSDDRYTKSVARALYHVNNYMHPQAILVDSQEEEPLFLPTLKKHASKLGIPGTIIELPTHAEDHVTWLTQLDAASLLHWNRVSINILIHAHTGASGSLVRLLKSLSAADFTSSALPHLTIELPERIDPPTAQFLANFRWPPENAQTPANINLLTLRHRILKHEATEEQSAVQFLESFWPANPRFAHVLVLSPQVELSPNFFHYLKMAVLEYHYSSQATDAGWDQKLFGVSLDLPTTQLGGSVPFTPPIASSGDVTSGFLWQAPNSNAALFTGSKWAELHEFVSQVLEVQHRSKTVPALIAEKSVSKQYPAWMEHALRLCKARGYWTVYPSRELSMNLATVHNDLYRLPEEYETDGFTVSLNDEDEVVIHRESLLDSLPKDRQLSRLNSLPLVAWDGSISSLEDVEEYAAAYATEFRRTVGGCDPSDKAPVSEALFCTEDEGI